MLTWTIYRSSHIDIGRLYTYGRSRWEGLHYFRMVTGWEGTVLPFGVKPTSVLVYNARHWELQRLHLHGHRILSRQTMCQGNQIAPRETCCFAVKRHGCGECEALWHQHQRALPVYCACPGGDQGFSHLSWKRKGKFCAQFWAQTWDWVVIVHILMIYCRRNYVVKITDGFFH